MSAEDAPRYRCFVNQCPMTGAIFLNGPDAPGICGHHFGTAGHDIVRVTQALLDWECITYEINLCRVALLKVDLDREAVAKSWTRLQPALARGGWGNELAPFSENYPQWGRKLERFLEARVKEAIQGVARA